MEHTLFLYIGIDSFFKMNKINELNLTALINSPYYFTLLENILLTNYEYHIGSIVFINLTNFLLLQ